MAGTRSSTRQAGKEDSKPSGSSGKAASNAGDKRSSSGAAPKAKRGKHVNGKEQSTIEASMGVEKVDSERSDVDMEDAPEQRKEQVLGNGDSGQASTEAVKSETTANGDSHDPGERENAKEESATSDSKTETNGHARGDDDKGSKTNGFDKLMHASEESKEATTATEDGTGSKVSASEGAVEESSKRENAVPSSILEKGIIYFFFRGRVGVNEPSDVNEIARSYIILRPLPHGAKLGEGPIGDAGNNRMLALPKKVLPASPKDRFMTFVEKSNCSLDNIKTQLASSDYATKTAGVRHTPAAAPIGEGVYAITQTGRETHLAYILTIPSELSEVQKDVGLRQRGSYITSAKNPEAPSTANASLPQKAEYPQEILDEFHGRGWMPLQPKLLDYDNTQFLLIGHGNDALEKAAMPQDEENETKNKETPVEEIEKLEGEDESRVDGLSEDHAVFKDLGLSLKEYPKVQTTW